MATIDAIELFAGIGVQARALEKMKLIRNYTSGKQHSSRCFESCIQ